MAQFFLKKILRLSFIDITADYNFVKHYIIIFLKFCYYIIFKISIIIIFDY